MIKDNELHNAKNRYHNALLLLEVIKHDKEMALRDKIRTYFMCHIIAISNVFIITNRNGMD